MLKYSDRLDPEGERRVLRALGNIMHECNNVCLCRERLVHDKEKTV